MCTQQSKLPKVAKHEKMTTKTLKTIFLNSIAKLLFWLHKKA